VQRQESRPNRNLYLKSVCIFSRPYGTNGSACYSVASICRRLSSSVALCIVARLELSGGGGGEPPVHVYRRSFLSENRP